MRVFLWWLLPDLNWGHKALQASALPTELKSRINWTLYILLNFPLFAKERLEGEFFAGFATPLCNMLDDFACHFNSAFCPPGDRIPKPVRCAFDPAGFYIRFVLQLTSGVRRYDSYEENHDTSSQECYPYHVISISLAIE